ncbi:MAG TPA: diaminopimelate epimerase [Fibrobacteraceae bacterium]|nr:diaminopimelate epimerase [Fibrobacteraceae bacterium]
MKFVKMHGIGNDYVYVDCFANPEPMQQPELARFVSHRHFGIGSDGLILIRPTRDADAEMVMYNADGSRSEMCGNGLRCVAKYVHDHGLSLRNPLSIKTGAGLLQAYILPDSQGLAVAVRIDMGVPVLDGLRIPTTWDRNPVANQKFTILGRQFEGTCVSMGNPHCVIYVDDVEHFPVHEFGPAIETASWFPRRVNVEFVQAISPTELRQRTWERGAGETWACGTGASAVCVAGVLTGRSSSHVTIHLLGGNLDLLWPGLGQSVQMTGPAVEIFQGEIPWPTNDKSLSD